MLNASVGVQRVLGRVRRPQEMAASSVEPSRHRSRVAAYHLRRGIHSVAAATRLVPLRDRQQAPHPAAHDGHLAAQQPVQDAQLAGQESTVAVARSSRPFFARLGPDRAVAVALAAILLGATAVSVSAGHPAPSTGGTTGAGTAPRIAVGGGTIGASDGTAQVGSVQLGVADPTTTPQSRFSAVDLTPSAGLNQPVSVEGPFIDDGTLVKPIAVDTSVPDGSALVKTYKVRPGDTATAIAAKFGVSKMTVFWANDLKSNTDIHVGQTLRIPPVTGLIVKVTATDTLDAIAARYNVDSADILATNGISDPNIVVGQILVIPGAKGQAIATIRPVPKPVVQPFQGSSGGGSNIPPPATYSGGKFIWPVVGGGNYISQYYHYGHYAIDIAADYGSTVRAAADGTVTFAGWKNNGGGYQVWIAHGSGLYTTYNHMSAITVGAGQHVGAGTQVGRVGMTGNATGPHLHFEVWIGPIWTTGQRVNPLAYF